ncbi:MAG: MBL fold metallo-hydrolase [Candidatus Alcyoniella australis]|nr:MBL fold metallo-hydrolase [Candidatus Alcyoniella australis]
MELEQLQPIVPGMFLLPAEDNGRFPRSHCIVVRGETEALIDAGCGIERLRALRERWTPELVIASHSHPDHVGGLWLFDDCRIFSPSQHSEIFWRFDPQSQRLTEPGEIAKQWIEFVTQATGVREVGFTDLYDDGHEFQLGRIKLQAIHAPGHLDDAYVFFEPHHGVALTFDIDLTGFGPWYGHRECDIDQMLDAIELVRALKPKLVVSSHKGIVRDDIDGRLVRYAAVIDQRDARLIELLRNPQTLDQLVEQSPIYGGFPYAPLVMRYWERQMIDKHLARLHQRGLVVRQGDSWATAPRGGRS